MRIKLVLARLSLLLCLASVAGVRAQQTGKGELPPSAPTPQSATIIPAPQQAPLTGARIVGDAAAPLGWKRYEFQFGAGSVASLVLPAHLEATQENVPVGNFPAATDHMFVATDGQGVYIIAYLEGLPLTVSDNPDSQTAFFKGLWSGVAEGFREVMRKKGLDVSIEQQPQRETTISGRRAQLQDFTVGKLAGHARAVIGGGNAYIIMTFSITGSLNSESMAFLDSFALRP